MIGEEQVYFLLLLIAIILQLVVSFREEKYYSIWSPMTMVSATYLYYCIIGPIRFLISENVFIVVRGVDHRPFFLLSWQAALLSYLGCWAGFSVANFNIKKVLFFNPTPKKIAKYLFNTFLISFGLLGFLAGSNLLAKFSYAEKQGSDFTGGYEGSFWGYLFQAIIFWVTPCLLALILFLKEKTRAYFLLIFICTVFLFINEGFRWRLVILCYSSVSAYHLILKKKFNTWLVIGLLIPFLLLMGAMEIARNYGLGLDTQKLKEAKKEDLLNSSTAETAVFAASGFIMTEYPKYYEYTYFDFLINAICAPIPRAFWPSKPDGSYMLAPVMNLYGGKESGTGQAVLWYCEYFMAFGWLGVFFIPFLVGVLLKYMWCWFLKHKDNYLAMILISIESGMMYVIISRGYLSGVLTMFIFSILPILVIKGINKSKQRIFQFRYNRIQ